jgi:hypothetical protein
MTDPKFAMCTVIEADRPTINGRIYPREVLEKAIEDYNKLGPSFVSCDLDGTSLSLAKVIATAEDFRLTESGHVVATIQFIEPMSEETAEMLLKLSDFSPMSIGTANEDGVIQPDLKFSYFALTPKERG